MNPKVSIIIPMHNSEKTIAKTLDSIQKQDFKDIEIIVIDDASTDRSRTIVANAKTKDRRICMIDIDSANGPRGAAYARNLGLKYAKGFYLMFMDSDDIYPSNHVISRLYEAVTTSHQKIAIGSFIELDSKKHIKSYEEYDMDLFYGYFFENEGVKNYVDYQYDYGFTRGIYERNLIINEKIVFPDLKYYEDPPFFVRAMISAGSFYCIKEPTYVYITRHNNASLNKEKTLSLIKGMKQIIDIANTHGYTDLSKLIIKRLVKEYSIGICKAMKNSEEIRINLLELLSDYYNANENQEFKHPVENQNRILLSNVNETYTKIVFTYLDELEKKEKSISYKVGLVVTKIPRKIFKNVKKIGK